MLKNKKLWLMVFALSCFIAIGTCVIVDLAINRKITWGMYPILSIPFGFLIITPLIAKKNGMVLSLSSLTISILPFLYLIEKITPVKEWFCPLGLPITIFSIITIWISYFILRFLKINVWYKVAIVVFICGVIMSPITNYFISASNLAEGNSSLNTFINIFSCVVLAAVFGICGYIKTMKKK